MCGIAGLVQPSSGRIEGAMVRRALNNLEHRGPDDAGVLYYNRREVKLYRTQDFPDVSSEVVLLHRRLSILDLSEAGWQPMGTKEGTYYIVFNGEIYNFRELRLELEALSYQFRSNSDTEVLLFAYIEWGVQALNRLVGMFAFAILDIQNRKIFLARDFFGIKPLYYTWSSRGLAFASEIPPLLELSGARRQVNPQRFYDYIRFGMTDHGAETLFKDIRQLPAAHYLEVFLDAPEETEPTRYWQIDLNNQVDLSFDAAAEKLRDIFLNNVSLHLRSDVSVGAALSGGIDSSSIVMAMRHLNPRLEINAFSYVADDLAISEEQWIDIVGSAGNLRVHKVKSNSKDLVEDLDRLIGLQGEPFGSTSIYAQRQVFQKAHEAGIKVMLDGQGADEILGGYTVYIAARLGSLLRCGKWVEAFHLLQGASKLPSMSAQSLLLRSMDFVVPSPLQEPLRRLIKKDLMPSWLNTQWFEERGVIPNRGGNLGLRDYLHHTLVKTSLPHLLRYEDRNSMAFSIESRVPFLSPELVNFMFSLPDEYLVAKDGTTKALFRQAMRGLVPNAILDRKDKIGFVTPEKNWLLEQHKWVSGVLASETAHQITAINHKEISHGWEGKVRESQGADLHIWRCVNMIAWAKKFSVEFET